ncbi:MAG: S8 family serine peptidase [Bacilli bacterium]|nr:S8 family serine peptidase [Bacilli bacterium]
MKRKNNLIILISSLFLLVGLPNLTNTQEKDPFLNEKVTLLSSANVAGEPNFSQQFHFNHINYDNIYSRYSGEGVTVAIIDSGINTNHVDFWDGLQTNISNKSAYIEERGGNYSNIVIQSVANYGLSIIEDDGDDPGHGTNVAGTIGALVNGVGGAGVSPKVNLMVLKINLYFTEVDRAIRYAADNGANIINMSIGAYEESFTDSFGYFNKGIDGASTFFQPAINYAHNKGVTLIAAAGNENTNRSSYPASNNHVIGVGALARNSHTSIANYSNYGSNNVDIYAPGTVYVSDVGSTTKYVEAPGTSFASPIVASAAALYKEANPYATPNQIAEALIESSVEFAPPSNPKAGVGRLDLKNLLSAIKVESVEISPKSKTLIVGEEVQLTATISPSDATNQEVIFISNDESVATVDEDSGLVTAIGVGVTEISVLTDDGMFDDSATITVIDPYEETLSLNSSNFKRNYVFGEELDLNNLSAIYTDQYNISHNISGSFLTLVSGNTKTLGEVTLKFSYQGLSDDITINVTNIGAPISGPSLNFTPLEQAGAYYDYFMDITHVECLLSNVLSSTWSLLENEYNAMSFEAQNELKDLAVIDLNPRYFIIINKYKYNDFIYLTTNNEQVTLFSNKSSQIVFAIIISFSLIGSSIFIFRKKKTNI